MATIAPSQTTLGCELWARPDCTDSFDTLLATADGIAPCCRACAEAWLELTAAPGPDEPPF